MSQETTSTLSDTQTPKDGDKTEKPACLLVSAGRLQQLQDGLQVLDSAGSEAQS